jgi:hypothetical protein
MTLNFLKSRIQMAGHAALARIGYGFTNYRHPARTAALGRVQDARSLAYTATTPLEGVEIDSALRATQLIPGEMAEVGVYKGGTAALMLAAEPKKRLHLFDTFEGLPGGGDYLVKGEYAGSVGEVSRTLGAYSDRVVFHRGLFPQDTGHEVADALFSFVHLDMDLYDGTLAAMRFFWPRLNGGGIVLCHDYPQIGGVVRAIDEFSRETPSGVFLPLSGQQCIAIKLTSE